VIPSGAEPPARPAGDAPDGPLRILVANWQDRENPSAGGAEIHMHAVFGGLAARGHRIEAVTAGFAGGAPHATLDGIRVHRTGGRHSYLLTAPRRIARVAEVLRPDLLIEDLNKVPLFTPLWSRTPVLLLVHHLFGAVAFQEASFPVALATWLLERPIPRVYRAVPTVAVSDSTRADLIVRGLSAARIGVIPNGVEIGALAPAPAGGRFPEPTLLYLGRLKRYKRVDLIIRAVARLVATGIPARLLVGGRGDHRDALERLAGELGIADRVHFLGFVTEEEKMELFRRAWVHVLTSPKEGWGISAMEAAGCGTATVASDSPGLRDSVRHGHTGLLVPHDDPEALAGALAEILSDPGRRDALGAEARRWAEAHAWGTVVDRWEALLLQLGRGRAPDGPPALPPVNFPL